MYELVSPSFTQTHNLELECIRPCWTFTPKGWSYVWSTCERSSVGSIGSEALLPMSRFPKVGGGGASSLSIDDPLGECALQFASRIQPHGASRSSGAREAVMHPELAVEIAASIASPSRRSLQDGTSTLKGSGCEPPPSGAEAAAQILAHEEPLSLTTDDLLKHGTSGSGSLLPPLPPPAVPPQMMTEVTQAVAAASARAQRSVEEIVCPDGRYTAAQPLVGEWVEHSSEEEGMIGSWFNAEVIEVRSAFLDLPVFECVGRLPLPIVGGTSDAAPRARTAPATTARCPSLIQWLYPRHARRTALLACLHSNPVLRFEGAC